MHVFWMEQAGDGPAFPELDLVPAHGIVLFIMFRLLTMHMEKSGRLLLAGSLLGGNPHKIGISDCNSVGKSPFKFY